ncbi:Thymidylate kinase [hydrothermal vent metagenome]|uniref:Thymidylate kinase n=1 Tax=hydrothermal vent metagenome TaxID=652676 RepID=A0A1W1D616_9ZZZZ
MFRLFLLLFFAPMMAFSHPISDLNEAYSNKGEDYQPRTQHLDKNGRAKFVNHLILSDSPYLLQHAHNPINWYSWSDEAFDKAKSENKMIFLSIGYATCHWCHVMEEESFDDLEVAALMNKHFIAIKVDREIQPDVDATFMNIAQLTSGSGGWPLNVFLTSDGRAFLTDTYITKDRLISVMPQLQHLWQNETGRITALTEQIDQMVKTVQSSQNNLRATALDEEIFEQTTQAILSTFDEIQGGFGEAPKFPQESIQLFLIDEQKRNPSKDKLTAITTTLDAMATGGFYDVIGGGFHRYSVDNAWMIPHFEKMLYNQAQLSLVYTRAYQLTQKPLYKRIAEQTLNYVLAELQDQHGGFTSATDADSEGEEGTFFVWSANELKSILTTKQFQLTSKWFDLSKHTEFEDKNVIRFYDVNQLQPSDYKAMDSLISTIYKARSQRIPPLTDDKVLLSWNALLIHSFLEAGQAFNNPHYLKVGVDTAKYLFDHFYQNEQLYRVSIDKGLSTSALFEDYAYFANALLAVFDQTHDSVWLGRAEQLVERMNEIFWDKQNFGFNMSAGKRNLNLSIKQFYDDALPSANGIAYQVLVKLSQRTSNKDYLTQAQQLLGVVSSFIKKGPYSYTSFVQGLNNATNGEVSAVQYAYDGRIRIHTQKLMNNQVLVDLSLDPIWHINSNQPLQDSLIATKVTNADTKNWTINNLTYPVGELAKLGFSKDKISIYKDKVKIKFDLINHSESYTPPTLELSLQACSDKVCLPPITVTLKP